VKIFVSFSIFLVVLLAACSPSGSGAECRGGICVSLEVEGPVMALEPALFIISVRTEKDTPNLGITLSYLSNVTIKDIEKSLDNAKLVYESKNLMTWMADTKGGEENIITGYVIFPKPTVSYGIFNSGLILSVGNASIMNVTDSITVYLDPEGKQVEDSQAKILLQTDYPPPTPPPDLTIVPPTPMPTVAWPTATPIPSPTLPAYPPPGEGINAGPDKNQPSPTMTQPAYP
jgi:hypothetical protein